mmetsp:Transcript_19705/g.59669  ORF Transcript_19705/g.59669 Transcript_19705/m.59669 type:complete len:709 (-) Transcript_19705:197-2323(-)
MASRASSRRSSYNYYPLQMDPRMDGRAGERPMVAPSNQSLTDALERTIEKERYVYGYGMPSPITQVARQVQEYIAALPSDVAHPEEVVGMDADEAQAILGTTAKPLNVYKQTEFLASAYSEEKHLGSMKVPRDAKSDSSRYGLALSPKYGGSECGTSIAGLRTVTDTDAMSTYTTGSVSTAYRRLQRGSDHGRSSPTAHRDIRTHRLRRASVAMQAALRFKNAREGKIPEKRMERLINLSSPRKYSMYVSPKGRVSGDFSPDTIYEADEKDSPEPVWKAREAKEARPRVGDHTGRWPWGYTNRQKMSKMHNGQAPERRHQRASSTYAAGRTMEWEEIADWKKRHHERNSFLDQEDLKYFQSHEGHVDEEELYGKHRNKASLDMGTPPGPVKGATMPEPGNHRRVSSTSSIMRDGGMQNHTFGIAAALSAAAIVRGKGKKKSPGKSKSSKISARKAWGHHNTLVGSESAGSTAGSSLLAEMLAHRRTSSNASVGKGSAKASPGGSGKRRSKKKRSSKRSASSKTASRRSCGVSARTMDSVDTLQSADWARIVDVYPSHEREIAVDVYPSPAREIGAAFEYDLGLDPKPGPTEAYGADSYPLFRQSHPDIDARLSARSNLGVAANPLAQKAHPEINLNSLPDTSPTPHSTPVAPRPRDVVVAVAVPSADDTGGDAPRHLSPTTQQAEFVKAMGFDDDESGSDEDGIGPLP